MREFAVVTVDFRLLGPVEVHVDGQPFDFGSPKERCVLAVLLYELGRPVATDVLVEHVWGMHPPENPRQSLYSNLSRLRRRLKEVAGTDLPKLRQRSGFYTLEADRGTVDLHRFRALREEAKTTSDSGDDDRAAALLHEAEQLWRGTPLTGLSGDWVDRIRARLEEERLASKLERIRVEMRLGRHADLIGEISQLVAQSPLHQVLVEHLMLALYRCGRQADALEVYRQTHELCREETGSEPVARLRDLHVRMLNEDPTLMADPTARPFSGTEPNSLPRDNPDFTGRVAELDKLFALTDSELAASTVTVVAISGMPGVGKSTFAVHAAHLLSTRYPRAFYLGLQAHHPLDEPLDPLSGLGILLRTLGVPPERIPGTVAERATLWRTQLAGRRALIVLDDAHDAEQIAPLLPGSGDCLVLITCRRRTIELPGLAWLPLEVLQPGEAVSLFTQIAGRDRIGEPANADEIVRLCGYLPLEIQLAGSRLRNRPAWSVNDLAARLARSQQHLDGLQSHRREVGASLELSYRYLTVRQQRLLRQLALHPGAEFSVYLAAAAVGDESFGATEHSLDVLFDHHLIEEPRPGRYAFHDLIREYAWQRALLDDEEAERRETGHRMMDYYLCLARWAADIVYPFNGRANTEPEYVPTTMPRLSARSDCQELMQTERANIFSIAHYAARNGLPKYVGWLSQVLGPFLDTWGFWEEAATLYQLAVRSLDEAGDSRGKARALTDLCLILGRTGRHVQALECAGSAIAIFRSQADRAGEADALDRMGLSLWQSSRFPEALSYHEEALAIRRVIRDRHGEADALGHSAMPLWHTSRYGEALKCLNKALAIYREIGDLHGEGSSLNNLGFVQQHLGFYDDAFDCYLKALEISRDIGDRQGEAILLDNIGEFCQRTGRHSESLDYFRRALIIYRAIGDRRHEADALNNLGAAFRLSRNYGEALISHEKALVLAHELNEPYQEARSLAGIGRAHLEDGDYIAAADDYRAALELSRQIGDPYQEALGEEGLGSAMLHIEGETVARRHWGQALTLYEQIHVPEADDLRGRLAAVNAADA